MTKVNDSESTLPGVALADMPEGTKDFLLAHSAKGKSVSEVIRDLLNQSATAAGYPRPTNHKPHAA